jgi:hypothetical protein
MKARNPSDIKPGMVSNYRFRFRNVPRKQKKKKRDFFEVVPFFPATDH